MSIWPDTPDRPYGEATFAGRRRGPGLDDLMLVPPLHLPDRLADVGRLGREPTPWDVDASCRIGGFAAAMPLVVPAMGSTPVAHRQGIPLARAAARAGVPLVLGENVATVHGYSERRGGLPSFKERALAYLDVLDDAGPDARGGLVMQQSVEDAMDELWWRVYSDPDFTPHIGAGRIGFEIKVGQGAKPGLGGVTLLDRKQAQSLHGEFAMDGPPRPDGRVERFSAPGTFTTDILEAQVRHLGNDFPHAKAWVKLPPSRDAAVMAAAAASGGADAVTVDGAEAGTALAPHVLLDHVGLPTLAVLAALRRSPPATDLIVSGGLVHGADIVKAVCLGATAAGLGRGPLEAVLAGGEKAADAWFTDRVDEVRKLAYALGHLGVADLDGDDVQALEGGLAEALGVAWAYGPTPQPRPGTPRAQALRGQAR